MPPQMGLGFGQIKLHVKGYLMSQSDWISNRDTDHCLVYSSTEVIHFKIVRLKRSFMPNRDLTTLSHGESFFNFESFCGFFQNPSNFQHKNRFREKDS